MQDLFIKEASFEKVGAHMLNRDATHWVKDIITHFLEQYPNLQNAGITVSWKRKDPGKGYAVGSIKLGNAQVPIIVNDYALAPMDVILIGGDSYPLTPKTLQTYMASPDAFKEVKGGMVSGSNLNIFGLTDSSMFANYGDASTREGVTYSERPAVKLASSEDAVESVIDRVSNINQDDLDKVVDTITNDTSLENSFKSNNTYDVIEKLASMKGQNEESHQENVLRNLDVDVSYVYQDTRGNYFIKEANSKIDYTWTTPISFVESTRMSNKYASENFVEHSPEIAGGSSFEMLENDQILYVSPDHKWTTFDKDSIPITENSKLAYNSVPDVGAEGVFKIGDKVSSPFEIISIEKTAENNDPVNSYNILGKESTLYMSKTGSHEISENSVEKTMTCYDVEGTHPNLGDHGTFILENNAVNPFEIVSIQKVAGAGNYEIVGYNGFEKISYYPLKGLKKNDLIPHETIKNAFYVPGNAKFVKLEGSKTTKDLLTETEKAANLNSEIKIICRSGEEMVSYYPVPLEAPEFINHLTEKNAFYLPSNTKFASLAGELEVSNEKSYEKVENHVGRDSAGLYYFEGPQFRKYAEEHEIRDLNKDDATWTLMVCGGSEDDCTKLQKLASSEVMAIRTELSAPKSIHEVGKALDEAFSKVAKHVPNFKIDLIKEASVLQDRSTVDAVLSLNLLNRENIMDYIQLAPTLEKVSSDLAKTLLTVRMGLSHIPERAVKTAMMSLSDVAGNLRQLETVISEVK